LAFLFRCTSLNRGLLRQDLDEAVALFRAVRSLHHPRGVEIGRFHGASAVLLGIAVGHKDKVISVDIAPRDDTALASVFSKLDLLNRVKSVVRDANEVKVEAPSDFVFIDGDHRYDSARQDHNKWGVLVRPGGFIIHHDMAKQRDFAAHWKDLARLRDQILERQVGFVNLVTGYGSMGVFRRGSCDWKSV